MSKENYGDTKTPGQETEQILEVAISPISRGPQSPMYRIDIIILGMKLGCNKKDWVQEKVRCRLFIA